MHVRSSKTCFLCGGLFERIDEISKEIVDKLKEYQYQSFLIGVAFPARILDLEDEFRSRMRIKGKESIKSQFNGIITKKVASMTKKKVEYALPETTVVLSLPSGTISVTSRSLWLSAFYSKGKRGIPQRSSQCPFCNGLGCTRCNYKGRADLSVESLASASFCEIFKADACNFIWLGSEDENSLVNGSGRPFFVEVVQPRRRFARPLISNKSKISLAEEGLRIVNVKRLERKITEIPPFDVTCKVYLKRNDETSELQLQKDEIEKNFTDCIVNVRLNRRYRVVKRHVKCTRVRVLDDGNVELAMDLEGGIPIKKLVTGQDSTVEPNLSHLLKSYHIDQNKPFDILDVVLRKTLASTRANRVVSTPDADATMDQA